MAFDVSKYKKIFLSEARENLKALNKSLLALEKKPKNLEPAEELMRAAHTLKSSAASMGYTQISELSHAVEDIFDALRSKKIQLKPKLIDLSFKCFDSLEASLRRIAKEKEEINTAPLIKKLKLALSHAEVVAEKFTPYRDEVSGMGPSIIQPIESIKVSTARLDTLMNLAEELLVNKMRIDRIATTKNYDDLPPAVDNLSRLVSDLQYNVMQARLVPVGEIFNRFPRMVRDLAQKAKKKINFVMEGSDIELDRTIIDQIGEPLVHLLRNAIDHGIEEKGLIRLEAKREKGYATISVENDGKGISWKAVIESALSRGIIDRATRDRYIKNIEGYKSEIENLLYHPRLSTSKTVTQVSGRGVGLNVVRTKVEALGGRVRLDSHPDKGCKFTMEFPLTLAIISALLAKVKDEIYAISLSDVERLVRVKRDQIKSYLDQEVAVVGGRDIPLLRLAKLFNIEVPKLIIPKRSEMTVVVKKGTAIAGLVVDSIISEQEIIVKPLGKLIRETKGFAGVTILGDGRAVLILDIASLI